MPDGTTINYRTNSTKETSVTGPTSELAVAGEGIVGHLSQVLQHKIAVTNLLGHVVADSDLANFDKFVPSAVAAVQKGTQVPLPERELDELAGWVVPLRHQDRLFGTLIIRNNPPPDDGIVPLAKSLSELLLYQMLVMDKIAHENRVLDKFFYDLFENSQPQEKLLRDSLFFNSQFFQIDFSEPHVVAVIVLENFLADVLQNQPVLPAEEHKLTATKDTIQEMLVKELGPSSPTIAYLGLDDFAVLLPHKLPAEKDSKKGSKKPKPEYLYSTEQLCRLVEGLEAKFERPVFMSVGQYFPELAGLIKSYRGAKQTVRLGIKLRPKTKVFYYTDMLLPIILEQADATLQKQFVANELGELISHPDLIETLLTHFDSNLNLKKTAYELKIHKNTLYYRLAKIKKILDIDPQEFSQAIKLKTALYLWQMQKEGGDPNLRISSE